MNCLGITGGLGAGKSETARCLVALGVPVLDTDHVARELVEPGQPALMDIVEAFGKAALDSEGRLDRAAMGRWVFHDEGDRRTLEGILHPLIFDAWTRWIAEPAQSGAPLCAVVIPLLHEKDYAAWFRAVVALGCSEGTQRQRLRMRNWTDEAIDQRIAAQWPMAEKMRRADYVVWSEGSLEVLHEQVRAVLGRAGWCPSRPGAT